jgi:uncharacterized membrane protein
MGLKGRFKTYFLRGLAVLLPSILTIWLFVLGYRFIRDHISIHISRGLVRLIILAMGGADAAARQRLIDFWVHGWGAVAGFLLALVGVCVVGVVLASVVGRTLWRAIENFIMTTPFLNRVYPYIKQFTDFFLTGTGREELSFKKVVAVEYPRKGVWAIGLVTGYGVGGISGSGGDLLTIFVPNSPMPATGFVVIASKDQVIEIDMTIEEAFRFVATVGVVAPGGGPPALPEQVLKGLKSSRENNFSEITR